MSNIINTEQIVATRTLHESDFEIVGLEHKARALLLLAEKYMTTRGTIIFLHNQWVRLYNEIEKDASLYNEQSLIRNLIIYFFNALLETQAAIS